MNWRTSTHTSEDMCVEVGWRKSSRSEVSSARGVRDSKDPEGPQLQLSLSAFRAMINGIKEMSSA